MNEIQRLLGELKESVGVACSFLRERERELANLNRSGRIVDRELKADADRIIEDMLLERLGPIGLPVLSEESGETGVHVSVGKRLVVDPLDGTVNYVRGLGPASVSVAICEGNEPLCGVLGMYPDGDVAWGGKGLGAFLNEKPIQVSGIEHADQAVICTGFPARYDLNDLERASDFIKSIGRYAKVRMLGAASISLFQVAKGAAEVYAEKNIMLWDVAAGLAIVEGANGRITIEKTGVDETLNVLASNGIVELPWSV